MVLVGDALYGNDLVISVEYYWRGDYCFFWYMVRFS